MNEEQGVVRRSLIERWFPERHVYLRSNGDTHGYVLTSDDLAMTRSRLKAGPGNMRELDAAHLLLKDLKRVVFGNGNKTNLGGRVRSVSYEGRDIGPRADGKAIVMAVIFIDVTFAETLADA